MVLYNFIRFMRDMLDVYCANDFFMYIVVCLIIILAFRILWSLLNLIKL